MEVKYVGKTITKLTCYTDKTNKEIKILEKNKVYDIEFDKPKGSYVYIVSILRNVTDDKSMDEMIYYASQISIKNNWKIDKVPIDI